MKPKTELGQEIYLMMLLQIIILRRRFRLIQLLQIPVAIVFGYMTDFVVWTLNPLKCSGYAMEWVFCVIGIFLVAVAAALLVGTISRQINKPLGEVGKRIFT